MDRLQPGNTAPDFTLPDQDGRPTALHDYRGRRLVVYFYPKDDTPGCTTEACQFNDNLAAFAKGSVPILGISADDEASHRAFRAKFGLNFSLLADLDRSVMRQYGAYGEVVRYGKTTEGVIRSTFLIDPDGKIAKAWYRVKPEGHAERVLAEIA